MTASCTVSDGLRSCTEPLNARPSSHAAQQSGSQAAAGRRGAHPEARRPAGDVGGKAGHVGALQHQPRAKCHLVSVQVVDLQQQQRSGLSASSSEDKNLLIGDPDANALAAWHCRQSIRPTWLRLSTPPQMLMTLEGVAMISAYLPEISLLVMSCGQQHSRLSELVPSLLPWFSALPQIPPLHCPQACPQHGPNACAHECSPYVWQPKVPESCSAHWRRPRFQTAAPP